MSVRGAFRLLGSNGVLLAAAAACFGVFGVRPLLLPYFEGAQGPVAEVLAGKLQLRSWGATHFAPAGEGTPLRNHDVLWVGKDAAAEIQLRDGRVLRLAPRTLLVIKRPFRTGKVEGAVPVEVVRGKAAPGNFVGPEVVPTERPPLQPAALVPSPSDSPAAAPTPAAPRSSPLPARTPDKAEVREHPANGGLVFLSGKKSSAKVPFSWSGRVTGRLVVTAATLKSVEIPLANADTAPVAIFGPADTSTAIGYEWKVLDVKGQLQRGPFRFEVKQMASKSFERAIESGADEDTIYVY